MAQTRFTCTLTTADEPACEYYARVTVVDSEGNTARGCPRHAVGAVGHLRRPAVPAPAVRDHAVAAPEEEHHLGIPVVGRERPAVAEDDRQARAPVLVEDLGAVRDEGSNVAGRVRPQT